MQPADMQTIGDISPFVKEIGTMTAEERLLSIIDAADTNDRDDVITRTLLVIALRESGIDFTEGLRGPIRACRRAALRMPLLRRARRDYRH